MGWVPSCNAGARRLPAASAGRARHEWNMAREGCVGVTWDSVVEGDVGTVVQDEVELLLRGSQGYRERHAPLYF